MSEGSNGITPPLPWVSALKPYVPGKPVEELERELGIKGSIKLASNENPLGPGPAALAAMRRAVSGAHLYPDAGGWRLREALAAHLGVNRDEIVLGNGSNEVLTMLCRVFLSPETSAVVSRYAFVAYRVVVGAQGGRLVEVPDREFGHDLEAMAAVCDDDTRLLFVANPNNPTGTMNDDASVRRLLREVPPHVLVVMDEAYFEYVERPDYVSALAMREERENLVVTRTFSKAYGLAGLRLGYGVMPRAVAGLLNRLREPFNANLVAQEAALAALADTEHLDTVVRLNKEERGVLHAGLQKRNLDPVQSEGNFVLFRSPIGGVALYEKLLRKGVIVRPLQPYGMMDHIRVSVGTAAENTRFIEALDTVLGEGA